MSAKRPATAQQLRSGSWQVIRRASQLGLRHALPTNLLLSRTRMPAGRVALQSTLPSPSWRAPQSCSVAKPPQHGHRDDHLDADDRLRTSAPSTRWGGVALPSPRTRAATASTRKGARANHTVLFGIRHSVRSVIMAARKRGAPPASSRSPYDPLGSGGGDNIH